MITNTAIAAQGSEAQDAAGEMAVLEKEFLSILKVSEKGAPLRGDLVLSMANMSPLTIDSLSHETPLS